MSRIDEALRRLAGAPSPDTRTPSMLDSYATEGKLQPEEPKKHPRVEERKIASFASAGPRPLELRVAANKAVPEQSRSGRHDASAEVEPKVDSEPLIELRPILNYAGFVGRSVGRHKLLSSATVTLVVSLTVVALSLLPRTYYVQAVLLAQRNAVMTALSNPGRAVPWDADAPTRAAAETVLRRDNLIALIEKTDLMREWERTRAPILKFKDWAKEVVTRYALTPEDKLDALIGTLETRMRVQAGPIGDGTVTIDLVWPDADMAARLVQEAQEAFLEARQKAETAAIGESIGILERYSKSLNEGINRRLAELQRAQEKAAPVVGSTPRAGETAAAPTLETILQPDTDDPFESDPDLGRMKAALSTKRQELARIEEARERQVAEIQGKLAQLRTVYTPQHPSVVTAEHNLAALMQETPQATALAAEIEELRAEYEERFNEQADAQINALHARAAGTPGVQAPRPRETVTAAPPVDRTPSTAREYASLSLRSELRQLESVLERTDSARIELAVSQAAFKYRYTVIRPAQVPRDPVFPNTNLVLAAGILASLVLAIAVAVAKDFLSNRILEPWQVERQLGLPVLGTLRIE